MVSEWMYANGDENFCATVSLSGAVLTPVLFGGKLVSPKSHKFHGGDKNIAENLSIAL
jgi:hypothetical protein